MNKGVLGGIKRLPFVPNWIGGGDPTYDGRVLTADSTQQGGVRLAPGTSVGNWSAPSPFGASYRAATDILMSTYDTNAATTDHTAAFQNAIAAAATILATGVAKVRIVLDTRQKYTIGGAVTAGANGQWAQIPLPYSQTVSGVIQLVGMPRGNDYSYISMGQSGTVIESSLGSAPAYNAAVGVASIFGGPASFAPSRTYTTGWSYIKFATQDITIRSAAPVICGIDAGWLTGFSFDGLLQFDTDQMAAIAATAGSLSFSGVTACVAPQAIPLVTPFALDWYGCHGDKLVVTGWTCGPYLGEMVHIRDVVVFWVTGAVVNVDASAQISRIDYLIDWNNAYGVATCSPASATPVSPLAAAAKGSGYAYSAPFPLEIGSWDIQTNASTVTAMNRVYDLMDANNLIALDASYSASHGGGALVPVLTFLGSGASTTGYISYSRVRNKTTWTFATSAASIPASTVAIRNAEGRDALVTITGGTVTAVKVNTITVLTGPGQCYLPSTGIISITYSVAPTWLWQPI